MRNLPMSRQSVRTMSTLVTNWIHALKNKRQCHEFKATEQLSKQKRKHTHACMHTRVHMHARTCTQENTVQSEYLGPSNSFHLNPFFAKGSVHALLVYCLLLQLVSKRGYRNLPSQKRFCPRRPTRSLQKQDKSNIT